MAQFNEILVGRFNRGLQKLLQVKGQAPAPQLAAEITPSIQLEDFTAAEHRFVHGISRYGHRNQASAVAAQLTSWRLRNPVGSNVIVVLEKLMLFPGAGDQPRVSVGSATVDLANLDGVTNSNLDARDRPQATLIVSNVTAAAPAGLTNAHVILSTPQLTTVATVYDLIVTPNQEIPILPGGAIQLDNQIANLIFGVSFIWRERYLEESERS